MASIEIRVGRWVARLVIEREPAASVAKDLSFCRCGQTPIFGSSIELDGVLHGTAECANPPS